MCDRADGAASEAHAEMLGVAEGALRKVLPDWLGTDRAPETETEVTVYALAMAASVLNLGRLVAKFE